MMRIVQSTIKKELFSGSLVDRCIGLMLVLATCMLETTRILNLFERGYSRISYRALLEIAAIVLLLRMRDSRFNRSLIDLFSLALVYKLIFLSTCFYANASAYQFFWTYLEKPIMTTLMLLLVVRTIWPASLSFPCLGLHGMQSGDEFFVRSIYPYAAIIATFLISIASLGYPAFWMPAVVAMAAFILLWVYGPATNDVVNFAVSENFSDKKKITLYETVIAESANLILRLRGKSMKKTECEQKIDDKKNDVSDEKID